MLYAISSAFKRLSMVSQVVDPSDVGIVGNLVRHSDSSLTAIIKEWYFSPLPHFLRCRERTCRFSCHLQVPLNLGAISPDDLHCLCPPVCMFLGGPTVRKHVLKQFNSTDRSPECNVGLHEKTDKLNFSTNRFIYHSSFKLAKTCPRTALL